MPKSARHYGGHARNRTYRQLGDFIDLGYVPVVDGDNWEMSKTLEYAFDDYAIAMLAQTSGQEPTFTTNS